MRLWHTDLIPVLPKQQLLGQWRELNCIFKLKNKHILINFVYDYPKVHLYSYSVAIITEMWGRGYKVNLENYRDSKKRFFCVREDTCKFLYDAGYRKADEVIDTYFEKLMEKISYYRKGDLFDSFSIRLIANEIRVKLKTEINMEGENNFSGVSKDEEA